MKEFADGDNLVMRRVVKEVKGHRVVVMEVGPSDIGELSDGVDEVSDNDAVMQEGSILEECQDGGSVF